MFDYSPFELMPISEVVKPKESRDPRKTPIQNIRYVDIASVSKSNFSITSEKELLGSDAPSRARKVIREGDIIYATTRPYLKAIAKVPKALNNQICSTGFCVLRATEKVLPEWLFYCAISDDLLQQIKPLMRGATYPAVSDKDVLNAKIPVPSIQEQLRIITRVKECLMRAKEIEILRKQSNSEAFSLSSAVFADHVDDMLTHGIGSGVLGDVVIDCKYGTSQKANTLSHGFPVLRMGNIQNGALDVSNLKHVDLTEKECAKYQLHEGDILINRTNSLELVGKSAVFQGLSDVWIYASYLVRIRVDQSKAIPEYVNAVINSRIGRDFVYRTARRAIGMVNINAKEMQLIPLPLPPLDEQRVLVNKMRETGEIIINLRTELEGDKIAQLQDSILHKAFAGEL